MQDTLRNELLRIAGAISFPSPGAVALGSYTAPHAAAAGPAAGIMPTANPVVAQLQHLLYDRCYCRRFDTAAAPAATPAQPNPQFLENLAAANAGRDRWDAGWRIQQSLPSGQTVAVKGAITRMIWPGEFHAPGTPGLPPGTGAEISLFAARDSRTMQPGFYFVFGETLGDQEEESSLVRFYWHITAAGAAPLVAAVTQTLNRFAVPFRFKCLSMAELYQRSDAAVLYAAKRYYHLLAQLLPPIYKTVRPHLIETTPLFSKEFAPGFSFAENPRTGESFGMSRCRIVAEAVCAAAARGAHTPDAWVNEIAAAFAAAGLSLERPYLNAGSSDRYDFNLDRAA